MMVRRAFIVVTLSLVAACAAAQWPALVSGQGTLVRVVAPVAWPPDGGSFEVRVEVEEVSDLAAFEFRLAFDPAVLAFDGVRAGALVVSTGRSTTCSGADFFTPQRDVFAFNCRTLGSEPLAPAGAGVLAVATFHPISRGPSPLYLTGVRLIDSLGGEISYAVAQGSVTIAVGARTAAPTATPVSALTEPSVTPANATPAATALPGQQTVPLAAGCNQAVNTYSPGVSVETVAASVRPARILKSIWEPHGDLWLGYSPDYPYVNDLSHPAFRGSLFLCVRSPGQFVQPSG
jgi:hypothetical protein